MYERLPFDKAEVVRENRAGIARRLKNPDDKRILEQWWERSIEQGGAASHPPEPPSRSPK